MAEKKSAKETNGKDSTKETKTRTAKTKADSRAKTEPKAKKEPAAKMTAKPAAKSKQRTKSRAKAKPKMNLKVIALGGLDEIGKNMTVLEYGDDIIIIDCGLAFPEDDMLGIDLVIPDVTYLTKNIDKIKGIISAHCPIFSSRLTYPYSGHC